jgi:Subtilase family
LSAFEIWCNRPVDESEERLEARAKKLLAAGSLEVPDLAGYYRIEAPDHELESLAKQLIELESVQGAYIKPPAQPPVLNEPSPRPDEPPVSTPDFSGYQGYLYGAPDGIDAEHAWTRPGGRGANVRIIDIEGEWRFSHEDLMQNQGGVIGGTPPNDVMWRNHGTAVIGILGGDQNTIGVTGICPDANCRGISIFPWSGSSAAAIRRAADALSPGDIILLELHRPGPRYNFASRTDQLGFIAIEWWPDDYDAIRYANARGVLVVEAAGNGAENLDDNLYDTPAVGFPSSWSNSFRRGARDSGAILVGAGAPPSRLHGKDRSRLAFSNYGAVVDAQGWGADVTTCGYGDYQGGTNEDLWYTRNFSGTSSASPMIVGAVACVQGILRGSCRPTLTPAAMRNLLRSTGSPQQDGVDKPATQRIGNRPDLKQMIDSLGLE